MKISKFLSHLSLLAICGTTTSFMNLGVPCESDNNTCCNQAAPQMMEQAQHEPAVVTQTEPSAPKVKQTKKYGECNYGGLIVFLDGLYWIANEPGLSYATIGQSEDSLASDSRAQNLRFGWEWGFRVGAGFNIPHGNWDSFISYTWFQDNAEGSVSTKEGQSVLPGLISAVANAKINPISGKIDLTPVEVEKASAKWNLFLNVADWELGKTFIPSKFFSFRPYMGAKAIWIQQENRIRYDGYKIVNEEGSYHTNLTNHYWGVGPKAGFNSQFWLGKGFSIYGNTGISLVLGEFNLNTKERVDVADESTNIVNLSSNFYSGQAVTDLQLGFRWDSNVCKTKKAVLCKCPSKAKKTNFSIALGWEQHMFFNQVQFLRIVDPTNQANFIQNASNLSVQGATGSIRFDF